MEHMSEEIEKTYFFDALQLFYENQWLFNSPVTEILTARSLDAFPQEWLSSLQALDNQELNDLVVNKIAKPEWTNGLKNYVEKSKRINRLPSSNTLSPIDLPKNFRIGFSYKKQHEIMHLAYLVHEQCASQGINVVVDLGAGLGYICQLLYHLYGYQVLGLEKRQANVNSAANRQRKMYPESLSHVKYACCDITCDSIETIESVLRSEFNDSANVCLIGLHACGDLSIHASKIFVAMKAAQILIVVSCCYHKLSISKTVETDPCNERQYFHHFPLSGSMQNAIDAFNIDTATFLRQPFLRLACQEPADRWTGMTKEAHDEHSFHVLSRAVLQLYATTNGFRLRKRVQKATRKSQCLNFRTYLKDSFLRYTLEPTGQSRRNKNKEHDFEADEKKITELWDDHREMLKTVEIYSGLQLMLQAPAESLVLQDRLCWMREQGLNASIVSVMNNSLSPRSFAIVSSKR